MTEQELNAALGIQKKINRLQGKLDDIRATGGVGSPGTDTPVQGGQSIGMGQVAAELELQIAELTEQRKEKQAIIRWCLEKAGLNEIEHRIMTLRYVECRSWELVRLSVAYSRSVVFDIHKKAVRRVLDEARMEKGRL